MNIKPSPTFMQAVAEVFDIDVDAVTPAHVIAAVRNERVRADVSSAH
jgi:hypothetical protein